MSKHPAPDALAIEQPAAKRPRTSAFLETILAFPEATLMTLQYDTLVSHVTELQIAHNELRKLVKRAQIPKHMLDVPEDSSFVVTVLEVPQTAVGKLPQKILVDQVMALRSAHTTLRDMLRDNGLDLTKAEINLADLTTFKREVADLKKLVKNGIVSSMVAALTGGSDNKYEFVGTYPSFPVLKATFHLEETDSLGIDADLFGPIISRIAFQTTTRDKTFRIEGSANLLYSPWDRSFRITGKFGSLRTNL